MADKKYYDKEGLEVTLYELIEMEPEWAANHIQELERTAPEGGTFQIDFGEKHYRVNFSAQHLLHVNTAGLEHLLFNGFSMALWAFHGAQYRETGRILSLERALHEAALRHPGDTAFFKEAIDNARSVK